MSNADKIVRLDKRLFLGEIAISPFINDQGYPRTKAFNANYEPPTLAEKCHYGILRD